MIKEKKSSEDNFSTPQFIELSNDFFYADNLENIEVSYNIINMFFSY